MNAVAELQRVEEAARVLVDFDWLAETVECQRFSRADLKTVEALPMHRVRRMAIRTTDPRVPVVDIRIDPDRGERVRVFNRRCARLATDGGQTPTIQSMLVVEVKLEPDSDRFVRYYLHPQRGPIISTHDLSF